MRIFLVITLLVVSVGSAQAREYSASQLRKMLEAGNPPAQGEVSTDSQEMSDFSSCKQMVRNFVSSVAGDYPNLVLVDSEIVYMEKVWTADGTVVATCNKVDKKLLVTTSNYK